MRPTRREQDRVADKLVAGLRLTEDENRTSTYDGDGLFLAAAETRKRAAERAAWGVTERRAA